jgi:UDP-N-acetylmuramate dehydrogenase
MYTTESNTDLQSLNTFGIKAKARNYVKIETVGGLQAYFRSRAFDEKKDLILGGGSNVLFTRDVEGTLIQPLIMGIEILRKDRQNVWLRAGAGTDWDGFVSYCVSNNYHGLENLSLIPGHVGASPIQNIGAYGREVKDMIEEVECIDTGSGKKRAFTNEECHFAYRDSIFKNELKNKVVISHVTYRLGLQADYELSYGGLMNELEGSGELSLQDIRQAVINIRRSKLPDPGETGNAGSFFKNPVVDEHTARRLLSSHPDMPRYPASAGKTKLAAGWLIDQCGWKGRKQGNAGVHPRQALVLVNLGGATGRDVMELSERIIGDVQKRFHIQLEREVNLY